MDQILERHWRLVMLWQRGFLVAVFAIGLVGSVIAARSGNGVTVGQFAAVVAIAVGGLIWNVVHVRKRTAGVSPPTSNV